MHRAAVFLIVPGRCGRTRIVTVSREACPLAARPPRLQVTRRPCSSQPALADTKSTVPGSRSVSVTPVAPCGPRFATSIV